MEPLVKAGGRVSYFSRAQSSARFFVRLRFNFNPARSEPSTHKRECVARRTAGPTINSHPGMLH